MYLPKGQGWREKYVVPKPLLPGDTVSLERPLGDFMLYQMQNRTSGLLGCPCWKSQHLCVQEQGTSLPREQVSAGKMVSEREHLCWLVLCQFDIS